MSDARVEVEDADGVRLVTFDRPEARNAFDAAMYGAVTDALATATSAGARAVVLTGRGSAFSAGQDLREMAAIATGEAPAGADAGFRGLLEALEGTDVPLLAAVNGVAVGLGLTMLAHVDLVLLDEAARLRVPFAELGVPPEAGSSYLLPERLGWQRAAAVLLASEWLDAEAAVAGGLALAVCPTGTVLAETLSLARRIAAFPAPNVAEIKRLMRAGERDALAAARVREEDAYRALFADPARNPGDALAAGLDGASG